MPPVTTPVLAVPFALPQLALVTKLSITRAGLFVMVALVLVEHPFASVTVTVYVPAANPELVAQLAPSLHA